MSDAVFYFGCISEDGHYLWLSPDRCVAPIKPDGSANPEAGVPEDILKDIDGDFVPERYKYRDGFAALRYVDEWTVLAFSDTSVDSRPGSNSAFLARGIKSFGDMVRSARRSWPSVWARFRFELKLVESDTCQWNRYGDRCGEVPKFLYAPDGDPDHLLRLCKKHRDDTAPTILMGLPYEEVTGEGGNDGRKDG